MRKTKIQLLPGEMEMAANAEIILIKNSIILKLKTFLEELQENQLEIIQQYHAFFPQEIIRTLPKVSRGENYKGLPWLVLDYPRHFEPGNIFAIRTLFWWGNFFSTTLHLSGRYKLLFENNIFSSYDLLSKSECYVCIAEQQWEHHMEENNYSLISQTDIKTISFLVQDKSFLKLAIKTSLNELAEADEKLCSNYEILLKACCQLPRR
jgi:hypothetical protein